MNNREQIAAILKDFIIPILKVICSIIVAWQTIKISMSANEIARLQTLITKNAQLPTVVVERNSYYDESTNKSNFNIDISILEGGKYSNFRSEVKSFLELDFQGYDENRYWVSYNTVEVPINYHYGKEYTYALYGLIETWTSNEFWTSLGTFRSDCEDYFQNVQAATEVLAQEPVLETSISSYLKITYLNFLEEEETLYYKINSDSMPENVIQISKELGEQKFQKHNQMIQDNLSPNTSNSDIDSIKELFQIVDTINAAGELYKA